MWDNGLMDGACEIPYGSCSPTWLCPDAHWSFCPSMAYVQNAVRGSYGILQPYFDLANQYGYANYMFSTSQGPSFPGHQFLFSGTSALDRDNSDQCGGFPCYKWFDAENADIPSNLPYACDAPDGPGPEDFYAYQIDPNSDTESLHYNWGYPCYTHNSLPTLLDNAKISWRYYLREGEPAQKGYTLWNAPGSHRRHMSQEHWSGVRSAL